MNRLPDVPPMFISVDLAQEPDFALGPLQVRPSLRRVIRNGSEEAVQPRVMQVLVALARANGGVVSREQLIETCWDGIVVGDDSITHSIAKVRQLADCDGKRAFEVETIPRVGYRLTQTPAASPASGQQPKRRNVRPILVGAGVAALLAILSWLHWQAPPQSHAPAAPPPRLASASKPDLTLAVLPFTNLSGDQAQEYFSDGMTEEINNALGNVPGLRVVARTSAFQFKNQNRDVRAVAHLLGASDVIEGSIRKENARVRVSVQLIRATDGVQLWSQTYDRNLTDIFVIQQDIASSIAAALRMPLGLEAEGQLVANRTNDLDSYEQYLRARALYRGRHVAEAISTLEQAVARDPGYAPARSLLAMSYGLVPVYLMNESRFSSVATGRTRIGNALDKSEAQAREALQLDPHQSEAYVALALIAADRLNWAAAEDDFRRALELNPNDADAIHLYGLMLTDTGRVKDALRSRQTLRELEPFVPIYNIMTASMMQMNGEDKAAIALLSATPGGGPTSYFRNIYLARAYAASGRYAEAADTLLAISPEVKRVSRKSVEDAAGLLRFLSLGRPLPFRLPVLEGELAFVYAHTREPERILQTAEHDVDLNFGDLAPLDSPWLPLYSPVRRTERFNAFVRKAGLVTYWRQRQWADRCHPQGADGFHCD